MCPKEKPIKKKPVKASKKKSPVKPKKKVAKKHVPEAKRSVKTKAIGKAKKKHVSATKSVKPVSKKLSAPKSKRTRTVQKPLFSTSLPEKKEIFQVKEPFVTTEINVEQDEPFLNGITNENIHEETNEFLEENENNGVDGFDIPESK